MFKQTSLNHLTFDENFSVVNGDIRSEEVISALLKDVDVIIPLAALVGAPLCKRDPIGAKSINNTAIRMMLSKLSKDQLVLMPTTNSAYGSGEQDNYCDEQSPLRPISEYAIEKVEIEKVLMERENSISFRLATVFGMSPRMRLDLLVNDFTYRAVKDRFLVLFEGHFKRNYIHVRDVVRVFLHALDNHEQMNGEIYNVGLSTANISKIELCEAIQNQLPSFVFNEQKMGEDPDKRNYIVSNAKIEAAGFQPAVSLHDGIAELIKGFEMINNNKYGNV